VEQICLKRVFNIPNTITVSRILLIPAAVYFFVRGSRNAALSVYLFAMLTDVLDGWIARKTNQITPLGKLLDPLADKLSLLAMLSLLYAENMIPRWVILLMIIRESVMIIGSAAALKRGIIVHALPIGKATTAFFTVSITAWFAGFDAMASIAMDISVILTVISTFWYAWVLAGKLHEEYTVRWRMRF